MARLSQNRADALKEVRALILNAGSRPQVVCFDYFDTLVHRSVYPEATKKLAAEQLSVAIGERLSGETLYQLRQGLEVLLCLQNSEAGLDPEFNLAVLAQRLFVALRQVITLPDYLDATLFEQLVISIEVSIEKQVQSTCRDAVALLALCSEQNIPTCLVSDFYLPEAAFREVLRYHDLEKYFDEVFVSADCGLTKGASGGLYLKVIETTVCPPDKMLMLGDNIHADYDMPLKHGMMACHIEAEAQKNHYAELSRAVPGHALSDADLTRDLERSLGKWGARYFPEMGLSLWYFTHRLFQQLVADNVPAVFFCSKEGEFLRKLFIEYQEQRFGRVVLPAYYLLVSRKATFVCSLKALPEEDFSRLFIHYHDLSLREFLLSLNFSEKESIALCAPLSLDIDRRHQRLSEQEPFFRLLGLESFQRSYEEHRLSQRANLVAYLMSFQQDIETRGLALVDVGWKGSIQNNLFYALNKRVSLRGYYLGLLSPTEVQEGNSKRGILFSDVPGHTPYIHVFNNNRSLFEMLLGASHGSADGYFSDCQFGVTGEERNSVVAHTVSGQDSGGDLFVTTLDLPEERALFNQHIKPLQDAFFNLHREITQKIMLARQAHPDLAWFARHHARMVFQPTKNEVDFFARLYHLENFGIFEFTDFQATERISISRRLRNLHRLWKNPSAFLETGVWPPIILRRLGLDFLQAIDGRKRYARIFGTKR